MIRKFKKCGLYALLFALLSIGLFLGFSDKANAATVYDDLLDTKGEWLVKIPESSNGFNIENSYVSLLRDSENSNCVAAYEFLLGNRSDTDYWQFASMSVNADETSYSTSWGFGVQNEVPAVFHTLTGTSQTRQLRINNNDITNDYYYITYSQNTGDHEVINVTCYLNLSQAVVLASYAPYGGQAGARMYNTFVSSNISITYPSGYDGNTPHIYNQVPNEEEKPPECSPFDFGCWLTGLVDMVGETFGTLFEAIAKFFTWLFIPDSDGLNTRLQNIVDTMADRLGILWLPNDLLIHYFELFVTGDPLNWSQPNHYPCNATDNTNNPFGTSFVSFFGHTTRLNDIIPYCKALGYGGNYGTVTTYINYLLVFFRLSLLLAVLRLFYKKIHEEIII